MGKLLQAAIFDLDGVITDTAEYHYLAWRQLANSIGIDFDKDINEKLKGISRMKSLELILQVGGKENSYSNEEKEVLAEEKNEVYKQLIINISEKDILVGIVAFLEQLKQNNVKIALASASKNAPAIINNLKLKQYFNEIVDVTKIKRGKPDPEIFLTAAKMVNVDPQNCIGIEDAKAGVEAIKGAGMFAVGVGLKESLGKADLLVSNTSELDYEEIATKFKAY
ncbi:beta-phosphoglucomutase [Anaerobacillus isosaccharinicus]|uniref:Beta-phosphoglucomutase n=1 Tax=Anaerobacillus isosaccharinicus TaxID=1532552 RepID=A0A1S2LIJ3_9BACI|nr:beta-phosphoglucomutase [Anaerobacillus isosaccharinicus]MBA5584728.1 beta-phosphoglucomutase [Anaerobacillus isosaccharinicus]QOY36903.1 beta-phosphoglucomutase [Anaerobacillus isosaccharinicus]